VGCVSLFPSCNILVISRMYKSSSIVMVVMVFMKHSCIFLISLSILSVCVYRNLFKSLVSRAVCGRIEITIQGLPPPHRLNKPLMSHITSAEEKQPGKANNQCQLDHR
jgi:hypothetical protein